VFEASYTISTDGFFASSRDRALIAPPLGYKHQAYVRGDGSTLSPVECAPALPACAAGGPVSACDIAQDLADPDVQAAFAQSTPPFFNEDSRGMDGEAFKLARADGRGFEMSRQPCTRDGCRPAPAGVQRLVDDLGRLDAAMILAPECQALNVPLQQAGKPMF
jgi:hypothetical protein